MNDRKHNIELQKKNNEIKGLKIHSLLDTRNKKITLKHKRE